MLIGVVFPIFIAITDACYYDPAQMRKLRYRQDGKASGIRHKAVIPWYTSGFE